MNDHNSEADQLLDPSRDPVVTDGAKYKVVLENDRVRVRVATHTFEATARVLDPDRDVDTCRVAQELARRKYGWGDGLPVEIRPDSPLAESATT